MTANCLMCEASLFGPFCSACPPNCGGEKGSCNQTTGDCEMCDPGYHGYHCNQQCSGNCGGNGTCRKSDGRCDECILGTFGSHCELTCPDHCNRTGCDQVVCLYSNYPLSHERPKTFYELKKSF